jgi:hypothetical protein
MHVSSPYSKQKDPELQNVINHRTKRMVPTHTQGHQLNTNSLATSDTNHKNSYTDRQTQTQHYQGSGSDEYRAMASSLFFTDGQTGAVGLRPSRQKQREIWLLMITHCEVTEHLHVSATIHARKLETDIRSPSPDTSLTSQITNYHRCQ